MIQRDSDHYVLSTGRVVSVFKGVIGLDFDADSHTYSVCEGYYDRVYFDDVADGSPWTDAEVLEFIDFNIMQWHRFRILKESKMEKREHDIKTGVYDAVMRAYDQAHKNDVEHEKNKTTFAKQLQANLDDHFKHLFK